MTFAIFADTTTRWTAYAGTEHLNDAWPNTSQQSWCGEYQPAGHAALAALDGEK
ncbi:hypothetical protein ACO2RV_16890 [Ancylobacter sp. VNQ12]|uniref:hypothetical protein n=1 Tax=Ancylobacter sp. VNQ12 TaxID=3400920 RepID=UPI003C103DAA